MTVCVPEGACVCLCVCVRAYVCLCVCVSVSVCQDEAVMSHRNVSNRLRHVEVEREELEHRLEHQQRALSEMERGALLSL